MLELDGFSMKVESVCFLVAIERVTEDGSIQTFVVGTMHS